GGPAPNCDDGNGCTDDSCNPATGCVHTNNTAPCNDGNACTTNDHCAGGACMGGAALNCDDGVACTVDSCNPLTGCVHDSSGCGTGGCPQTDLGSTVPQSVPGSTLGATDNFQPPCAFAGGAGDHTYKFTAPQTGNYQIDL